MLPMTSPNDPVFFMHHCMVDKLWYEWQLRFPNQGYLPVSGGPFGQNLNDPMNSTPPGLVGNRSVDVLDSVVLDIEYDSVLAGTPSPHTGPVVRPTGQSLIVNDAPVSGSIAAAGEVDEYTFDVAAFGLHTIETSGNSDTVMTLSGPDNASNELTFNDDGGVNFNSRIALNVSVGNYMIRVRMFSTAATGSYRIGVSTGAAPTLTELVVNGQLLDAAISAGSESDLYRFQALSQGDYVIETSGPTDTFLTLFGPDSQIVHLAENDDGGFNLNSRISQTLAPGEYFVRVRHFSPQSTGPYQVGVRR
jgi:tyrosinase